MYIADVLINVIASNKTLVDKFKLQSDELLELRQKTKSLEVSQ